MKIKKVIGVLTTTIFMIGMAIVPAFAANNEVQTENKGILVQQEITEEDLGDGYTVTRILEAYKPKVQPYGFYEYVTGYNTYVVSKTGSGVVLLLNFEQDFRYNAGDKKVEGLSYRAFPDIKREDVVLSATADKNDYNHKLTTSSSGTQKYTASQYFKYILKESSKETRKLVSISCDSTGKIY